MLPYIMNMPNTLEELKAGDLNEPVGEETEEIESTSVIRMIDRGMRTAEIIESIPQEDTQVSIDELFKALDTPNLLQKTRRRYRQVLYKLCGYCVLLPTAMKVAASYDRSHKPIVGSGFGDVWKGGYRDCKVAVKVIRTYLADGAQRQRRLTGKFCKEAVVWMTLRHPNILPLIGAKLTGCQELEMISEWMENGNINRFIWKHPDKRIELLKGIAGGLIYIHNEGLVHGDLKGANVLVDESGNALIADFGLTMNIFDPDGLLSLSLDGWGVSIQWTSPELLPSDQPERTRPTKASDCYAFAMVIYEVVSGHLPFLKTPDATVIDKVLEGGRPEYEPSFPDDLWDLLESCWDSRPSNRPSVEDVLRRLENCSLPDPYKYIAI